MKRINDNAEWTQYCAELDFNASVTNSPRPIPRRPTEYPCLVGSNWLSTERGFEHIFYYLREKVCPACGTKTGEWVHESSASSMVNAAVKEH